MFNCNIETCPKYDNSKLGCCTLNESHFWICRQTYQMKRIADSLQKIEAKPKEDFKSLKDISATLTEMEKRMSESGSAADSKALQTIAESMLKPHPEKAKIIPRKPKRRGA